MIAAARVLMLMAHNGLAHGSFAKTHAKKETPGAASVLAGVLAFVPVAVLVERGSSGADVYGWMGTLAVYGFLTAYALVAVALPVHLRRRGRLGVGGVVLSVTATVATLLAMVGTVFPVPPAPYRYLPYVYVAYLAGGMALVCGLAAACCGCLRAGFADVFVPDMRVFADVIGEQGDAFR